MAQNLLRPLRLRGEGGEGGVEAALVTYSDSAQGFAIGHPGTWTQDTSFTNGMKFVGGDDYMTVEFVTPSDGPPARGIICRLSDPS